MRVLPRQMEALLRQTHPLRDIVVVDNASTDGTATMLAERYPQVIVLSMPENLGAAGGWAAGLSYAAATDKGYGWVWTFDQDSTPEYNALETLLAGVKELDGRETDVGMVVPVAFHPGTAVQYHALLWRDGFVNPSAQQRGRRIWFADMAIASGSLLLHRVIREVGIPRADFFMDICDFEYCLRIRAHGYKIAVISRAEMAHEIGNTRKINLPGYKGLWIDQPPFREYYISRNLAYLAWRLYPNLATKISIVRHLTAHFAGVLLFSSDGPACAIKMIQGFVDGMRGRLGIRIRPGAEGFA
jgi:GT2 family glycosyltransferase